MTLWKWWRETRFRYVVAVIVTAYFAVQAAEPVKQVGPIGPCVGNGLTTEQHLLILDRRITDPSTSPNDRAAFQRTRAQLAALIGTCPPGTYPVLFWREWRTDFWTRSWADESWQQMTSVMMVLAVLLALGGPGMKEAGMSLALPVSRRRAILQHVGMSAGAAFTLPALALGIVTMRVEAAPTLPIALELAAWATPFIAAGIAASCYASVATRDFGRAALFATVIIASGFALDREFTAAGQSFRYDAIFFVPGMQAAMFAASVLALGLGTLAWYRFAHNDY